MKNLRMMAAFSALSILVLPGCVSQIESSVQKSVSALWAGSNDRPEVDLRQLKLGTQQRMHFELEDGSVCSCTAISNGMKMSGTILTLDCSGSGGATAEDCAVLADTYQFASKQGRLSVCGKNQDCVKY